MESDLEDKIVFEYIVRGRAFKNWNWPTQESGNPNLGPLIYKIKLLDFLSWPSKTLYTSFIEAFDRELDTIFRF